MSADVAWETVVQEQNRPRVADDPSASGGGGGGETMACSVCGARRFVLHQSG